MHPMRNSDCAVVYGAAYSVYVQAVCLTLWAKGVKYRLVEVDVFAPGGPPPDYLARHPFGRIPAFEHGAIKLYETAPICRYIDEAFDGPPLQPGSPRERAVMGQAISIMDNYAYRTLVWDIYVERIVRPKQSVASDLARIEAALPRAKLCLKALDLLAPDSDWLAGPAPSLADFHAAPMFNLFTMAPDAAQLMEPNRRLGNWWERVSLYAETAQILTPN